ncbi:hypothetical protein [Pseudomonas aeruginosa]|uniref:hypothetical protein n=1 Tax=Pseudomonas aeruginosa TaxID=287 RepID=UPI000A41445C|nr:hypothetical protein [Pseudomonas aeruginosa]EIU3490960.1 hypothetical protein [Pseudomonas aeruginosa]MBA4944015.1 hypothetical protein [Pseudomonas aeruginosa]MBG4883729.1 hypothetical protein [Pseudomonas aeruginosa]MBI7254314.1 hypothetical protein [Pseudomonas aeruginosa]MBI7735754.1 hypothetical protein [Pseudomonas aeruginosa]
MKSVYKRVITFHCLGTIYYQGLAFGEAGKHLIESKQNNLFVPGMINICLAAEIFLKSLNATMTYILDEEGGEIVSSGRDESLVIKPGGQGHHLSKLYDKLPDDIKESIKNFARAEGYGGDIAEGLRRYDKVFVEWRYIYEKNDPGVLGTSPLFEICNAINAHCRHWVDQMVSAADEKIDEDHPDFEPAEPEGKRVL